jgi:C-terminal processing protease CtpA/Prc
MRVGLVVAALIVTACSGRSEPPIEDKPETREAPDGFIGVRYLWSEAGAVIDSIVPETPAERAGLRVRDVIVSVDGDTLADGYGLTRAIIRSPLRSTKTLGILRDGEPMTVRVRVTTWPTQERNSRPDFAKSEIERRLESDERAERERRLESDEWAERERRLER